MKLIELLPPRIRDIKEIADFQEAVQPTIDEIDEKCRQILVNQNPLYADLDGVTVWEEWLMIEPDSSKTLEQRRLDIISKLNERLPFTLVQLHRILAGIVGWDNFKIITYPGEPKLKITLELSDIDYAGNISNLLSHIIPAHVFYDVYDHYESASMVDFAVAGLGTCIIETPIKDNIAQIYIGSPYLESATIETSIGD